MYFRKSWVILGLPFVKFCLASITVNNPRSHLLLVGPTHASLQAFGRYALAGLSFVVIADPSVVFELMWYAYEVFRLFELMLKYQEVYLLPPNPPLFFDIIRFACEQRDAISKLPSRWSVAHITSFFLHIFRYTSLSGMLIVHTGSTH